MTMETRVAVLEANHQALAEAVRTGFALRDESWGKAVQSLVEDIRWIRNLLVVTVLLGVLLGVLGVLLR